MKNKFKFLVVTVLTVLLITGTSISAAGFSNLHFDVPANTPVYSNSYDRSCNYAYVTATVNSVYPYSGTDNFIYLKLGNLHNGTVRGYNTVQEGTSSNLYVDQANLTIKPVKLVMKGNDASLDCNAITSFNAR
ncbi:MAG: hypothetical protein WCG21_06555 [Eubacteriales bacterium]